MDVQKIIEKMRNNASGIRFSELKFVCSSFFGKPRQIGTSHCIYKMPWARDPRINIQETNGMAKPYQVKQVLDALAKLEESRDGC